VIADPIGTYAGFNVITRGVNTALNPEGVEPDQLSWMVNGTARNGYPQCRPGWSKSPLKFLDENGDTDETVKAAFENGRWQGSSAYTDSRGANFIVASISGRIFRIDLGTLQVLDLSTTSGESNPDNQDQVWMVRAEEFLIIQDGSSIPLIFNGGSLRRSRPSSTTTESEVPIGSVMAYNKGRLWVTLPDKKSFVAGDLAYSLTQSTADILSFTENTFLNGGGAFVVGEDAGDIVAMRSIAIQDTTTGQGPLQVFTTQGVMSIDAPFDRDQWQNLQSPIQTISNLSAGAVSQNSTINVNGDIWFRAEDGIRSFSIARRDHGTWVNTPLSTEVSRTLDADNRPALRFGSAALFDNRLLQLASPYRYADSAGNVHGYVHQGIVALDFHPVSGMFSRSQPSWEGVWTGLLVLQIVHQPDSNRCYLFTINPDDDTIEMWELSRDDKFDSTDNPIQWVIETPSYRFRDDGWSYKRLRTASVWYDRLTGQIDFTSKFRADAEPIWQDHHSWQEQAAYRDCNLVPCNTPLNYREQYRSRVRLPEFAIDCDEATGKPYSDGYSFAMRLEITGFAQIKRLRLEGMEKPEDFVGACPAAVVAAGSVTGCPENDYSYITAP
jgi:hypothetical protein